MKHSVYERFMPECYLDTLLVEVLLKVSNAVNHKKGNSGVIQGLQSLSTFAVGIIDEDRREVVGLSDFSIKKEVSSQFTELREHTAKKQYVIRICPAIEKWILTECEKAGIDIGSEPYKLPNTVKGLAKLKSSLQRNDHRFKRLFNDMLDSKGCEEIKRLKSWLTYLQEKQEESNDADIKALFNV